MKEKIRLYLVAFRNVILTLNIIKLRFLFWPRKMVCITQAELFNLGSLAGLRKLKQKNVYDVVGPDSIQTIRFLIPNKWMHEEASYTKDMITLALSSKLVQPKVVFEIGTLDGYTALLFALNTPDDTRIYTLDLLPGKAPVLPITEMDRKHVISRNQIRELVFRGKPEEIKITPLFGDSHRFDYSAYRGKVDLFFIDGAHSYPCVKSDTENALKCMKRGGLLIWHDYGRVGVNGVSKYLHELAEEMPIFSVPGSSLAFSVIP